ncbi:hypothetical protein PTSG_07608 [Salpingoeca rosetta]|uniref:Uncharacterized protein n=1 Tax=Salpingoeca rosetta (strain ATCC 50818 / BSB-021) TaxID=946362 RepID=F2UH92_SALR5|nr:uncharacterized protein PTSG_07608 [Salpingoeca rosetta]EGD76491.1 hypothetical protein PTSG_07608 [Salpingoeca rosetta]|eukprot:XP_004991405.1 hypothetical protein PTSG_07608 [Salpingoeca rosetta]
MSGGRAGGIVLGYAGFLFVMGFLGFAMGNFQSKAKSAIIVGSACSLLQVIAYFLHISSSMSGAGLMIAKAFMTVNTALFAWRAYLAWQSPEKQHVAILVAVMALGSLAALTVLALTPSAPKRHEAQKTK